MTDQRGTPRIAGYCSRLAEPFSIEPWKPLSKAAVEALPPLPSSQVRGWRIGVPSPPAATPAAPPPGPAPSPSTAPAENAFQRLAQAPAQQIAPFLLHEHPQTIALILSQLAPVKTAGILHHLPEGIQADLIYRISTMETVLPTTIDALRTSLTQGLLEILGGEQVVGGPRVAAEILHRSGANAERRLLAQLQAQNPQLAEVVQNQLFAFGDLLSMSDRDIQVLLGAVDQKDLVAALKGAGKELTEKFLANMSEQVRIFISEELELLSPIHQATVDEARLRIVERVRQLEEQGQITITRGSEDLLAK